MSSIFPKVCACASRSRKCGPPPRFPCFRSSGARELRSSGLVAHAACRRVSSAATASLSLDFGREEATARGCTRGGWLTSSLNFGWRRGLGKLDSRAGGAGGGRGCEIGLAARFQGKREFEDSERAAEGPASLSVGSSSESSVMGRKSEDDGSGRFAMFAGARERYWSKIQELPFWSKINF